MPQFCISTRIGAGAKEHVVHDLTPGKCNRLPVPVYRIPLGNYLTPQRALLSARQIYSDAVGCRSCCKEYELH